MFHLRHIGIVAKGDIEVLKKFYKALINPHLIQEQIEEGNNIDKIVGIKKVKLKTCKLFSHNVNIEIIQYLNPEIEINYNKLPSFSGINHIAFTVDNFEEAKSTIIRNGGYCENENFIKKQNGKVKYVKYLRDPENNILEIVEV